MHRTASFFFALLIVAQAFAGDDKLGHSKHGTAFDTGMRLKPWKMEGIGTAPFPISRKGTEVQEWYDQGNELLHSFWFEEAERSFRWCHKLEPDNAMVYFGLARCGLNWFTFGAGETPELQRYRDFLKEAMKRRGTVTERERMYIEAWDAGWGKKDEEARQEVVKRLQKICVLYPEDIEAKCQLAFFNIGEGSALANEYLIQQVLAINPMHPGAHHARIHNWDGIDSAQAVASCELYGKAAPGIGHSLHMPGHVYSKVGMWHEAAIAMDGATRVELRYMNDRLALPFETWNYAHNRDYLCYIQEQLGRAEASIQGSRDLLESPHDPGNSRGEYPAFVPLVRAMLKFERWEQILDGKSLPTPKEPYFAPLKSAAEAIALVGVGKVADARERLTGVRKEWSRQVEAEIAKTPEKAEALRKLAEESEPMLLKVAEAKLLMAEGNRLDGIRLLLDLAETERKDRDAHQYLNDPPSDAWPVMRLVGDAYFEGKDFTSAIEAYERALEQELNDAWCLAGLAKSWAAVGQRDKASAYASRFLAVWDGADAGLRWMREVQALGLNAMQRSETLRPERAYDPRALDTIGPSNWRPFAAPRLECLDVDGKPVTLNDYKGRNVLLVFYLSDQCPHCMDQLTAINKRLEEFDGANTTVLAVSGAKPEANKASAGLSPLKVGLLSDVDHANARRFASYDDFEDMELHSTILIDKNGLVKWKRTGGDPFADVDFLINEIRRWSQ